MSKGRFTADDYLITTPKGIIPILYRVMKKHLPFVSMKDLEVVDHMH